VLGKAASDREQAGRTARKMLVAVKHIWTDTYHLPLESSKQFWTPFKRFTELALFEHRKRPAYTRGKQFWPPDSLRAPVKKVQTASISRRRYRSPNSEGWKPGTSVGLSLERDVTGSAETLWGEKLWEEDHLRNDRINKHRIDQRWTTLACSLLIWNINSLSRIERLNPEHSGQKTLQFVAWISSAGKSHGWSRH